MAEYIRLWNTSVWHRKMGGCMHFPYRYTIQDLDGVRVSALCVCMYSQVVKTWCCWMESHWAPLSFNMANSTRRLTKRKFCPHCGSNLSISTYYKHHDLHGTSPTSVQSQFCQTAAPEPCGLNDDPLFEPPFAEDFSNDMEFMKVSYACTALLDVCSGIKSSPHIHHVHNTYK